jgi:hypothetical protein
LEEAINYYLELLEKDSKAVCIFPTNVEVEQFNDAAQQRVASSLGKSVLEIKARDSAVKDLK